MLPATSLQRRAYNWEGKQLTTTFDHETYLSPLTWRYGSDAMRIVWSEANKRRLLRRFWVALATAQHEAGLVTAEQAAAERGIPVEALGARHG